MRPALGRYERMDLVDDDGLDRAERFTRFGREQQIERLRGRDQNVGGLALEARPFGVWRVAGAERYHRSDERISSAFSDPRDAGQRRTKIAFDVDSQRF